MLASSLTPPVGISLDLFIPTPTPITVNLKWGQECLWVVNTECGSGVSHLGRLPTEHLALSMCFLVPDPLSHRRVLPDSIKMPEEVMEVMRRRKNTASSCQNTQSAVIMARHPATGTQNCRYLRIDSYIPCCCHLRAAHLRSHRVFFPVKMHCANVGP